MSLLLWAQAAFRSPAAAPDPGPPVSETFLFPRQTFQSAGTQRVWVQPRGAFFPITARDIAGSNVPFLRSITMGTRTSLDLYTVGGASSTASLDLSDDWENRGFMRLETGDATITVRPDDTAAPYASWIEDDDVIGAFYDRLVGATGSTQLRVSFGLNERAPERIYSASRTMDRAFSGFPAWGGGNVAAPINFVHAGANFRVYQVIPFDGVAVGGIHGACRIHIRNRDKNRGNNTLEEMPDKIRISKGAGDTADWTGLPWEFTRTTDANRFTNAGSGGNARKQVWYNADRTVAAGDTPASLGIADPTQSGVDGESFTVEFIYQ